MRVSIHVLVPGCSEEDVQQIIEEMKLEWRGSLLPGSENTRQKVAYIHINHLLQPLEVDGSI